MECCNGGGAGFDRKASYCSASDCAQVVAFIECGLVACTTKPGCLPCQGVGVRTGGRLHPGLAGERLLKQRPKLFSCLFRRPRGCWGLREVAPGSWLVVRGCVLRIEVYCVPACLPALPLLGVLLIAFAFLVFARLYRTGCLPFCVLVCALGGFAPGALTGLGPPPPLCLILGTRSEADNSPCDSLWHGSIPLSSMHE